jgi:hypothetical protein
MPEAWRTVRVFISSSFRDMQAERDHLVRFVFPRLRGEAAVRVPSRTPAARGRSELSEGLRDRGAAGSGSERKGSQW